MKYLDGDTTLVNFPVIWVVARLLAATGPTSRSALVETLRPPAVVADGDKNAFTASLAVAERLGLLKEDDDEEKIWSLGPQLEGKGGETGPQFSDADQFRNLCRAAFFARELKDLAEGDRPSDVAVGLAWLTSRNPREPLAKSWDDGPNEELQRFNLLEHSVLNGTQWGHFRRWAIDLGFATESKDRLCVDVEPVMASSVREMNAGRVTAKTFVDRVVKATPVLDRGVIADYVETQLEVPRGLGDAVAGHLLYHTIRRLEARKMVELERGADARGTVAFAIQGGTVPIDAVTVMEATGVN
jgi:hypothetical protein